MSGAVGTLVRADALPQVDLLPPEVRERRRTGRLRGWLVLCLLCVVTACGAVWALSWMEQQRVQDELAAVEARSAALAVEQQRYAEVPSVLSQLRALEAARAQATSTEVLWQPYWSAIAATAPDSVSIESLTASVAPTVVDGAATDATTAGPPGSIVFTARSRDLPDTATWVEQLAAVPGFSDPWFSTASITEFEGVVYYTVSAQVDIDSSAFAHRFEGGK